VTLIGPVVAPEEKQLVVLDGATKRSAEIIENALALFRAGCLGLKELPCAKGLVLVVFKRGAMKLIRAGFGDDGNGGTADHALLGIKIVGRDVYFLNGFSRRDIHGVVRQPNEHVGGSVHTRVV